MTNIAIITGATGGFGREFIKLLLKKENVDESAILQDEKNLIENKTKIKERCSFN